MPEVFMSVIAYDFIIVTTHFGRIKSQRIEKRAKKYFSIF